MEDLSRYWLFGDIPIDRLSVERALERIDDWLVQGRRRGYVLAMNPEKVLALQRSPDLLEFFKGATVLIADGVGVVLASRLLGGVRVPRVVGTDLMLALCEFAAERGHSIYLYGGKKEVNEEAGQILSRRFPGLRLVGSCDGYVPDDETDRVLESINSARPDILFIALGSPMQERWLQAHLPSLDVGVCQTVGGSLDAITGTVKRPPRVVQRMGLEWLYRLVKQPGRARRQLALPAFVGLVLRTKLGR